MSINTPRSRLIRQIGDAEERKRKKIEQLANSRRVVEAEEIELNRIESEIVDLRIAYHKASK